MIKECLCGQPVSSAASQCKSCGTPLTLEKVNELFPEPTSGDNARDAKAERRAQALKDVQTFQGA